MHDDADTPEVEAKPSSVQDLPLRPTNAAAMPPVGPTPSPTPPELAESATPPRPSADEAYGFAALTPAETRVLGCLIEKQLTTPEYYPLTLNALVMACNQKSNRAPTVEYDEKIVVRAVDALRSRKFAWMMTTAGGRVPKYEHRLEERLFITAKAEIAVLCELLLRGPQTIGELRSHAGRMHPFSGIEPVQAAIEALASRPAPLIVRLPRLPGHKETRLMHLLAGRPEAGAAPAEPPPEAVRAVVEAEEARLATLENEVRELHREVADLKAALEAFRSQFG